MSADVTFIQATQPKLSDPTGKNQDEPGGSKHGHARDGNWICEMRNDSAELSQGKKNPEGALPGSPPPWRKFSPRASLRSPPRFRPPVTAHNFAKAKDDGNRDIPERALGEFGSSNETEK